MVQKLPLLFNTVKHLKPVQVLHQVKYRLRKTGNLSAYEKNLSFEKIRLLSFQSLPPVQHHYLGNNNFSFLNIQKSFEGEIDWNFQKYGKLWNYNLQYFNFLLQENLSIEEKENLLLSLYEWLNKGLLPLEPYPSSLRIVNMIRFYSRNEKISGEVLSYLHAELNFLSKRLEYHLLGNHLLENGFALIMGGAFFDKESWSETGRKIIEEELREQILSDGGHFELSPMYHQIIFFRLLELIDWYSSYEAKTPSFEEFLRKRAAIMFSWLSKTSFSNGNIPHFNDSTTGIAYPNEYLFSYAKQLEITASQDPLGNSGYRAFNIGNYEIRIDVAQIGPTYQPGHAHADTLSFVLNYKNTPLFVEQGTSTYNIGERRATERGTAAHNTVVVAGKNQSEVWSGFRVGKRAKTKVTVDNQTELRAEHDGYKGLGIVHRRIFKFHNKRISIQDQVEGSPEHLKEFHLHFAPSMKVEQKNGIIEFDFGQLKFTGAKGLRIENYEMALGYNLYEKAKKLIVCFNGSLATEILFKE